MTIHASLLEVLWLVIACSGFSISWINLLSARADYQKYRNSPVPVQVFMTRRIYYAAMTYSTLHGDFMLAAIWGFFNEPPPPPLYSMPQSLGNVLAWIAASLLLTGIASYSMKWRHALSTGDYGEGGRRQTDAVHGVPVQDEIHILKEKLVRATDQVERLVSRASLNEKLATLDQKADEIKETVTRVDEKLPENGHSHD